MWTGRCKKTLQKDTGKSNADKVTINKDAQAVGSRACLSIKRNNKLAAGVRNTEWRRIAFNSSGIQVRCSP